MEDKNSQINIYKPPLIQNENNNCDYNYIYDGGCINCGEKIVLMGDVLLCGSIYVKKNGILEIRPGTNIYIKNECEPIVIVIDNDGIINADGNKCEKIIFQSSNKNNVKSQWGGIIIHGYDCNFEHECVKSLIYKCNRCNKNCCCKNSILNHVIIKNAGINNYDSLMLSGIDNNIKIDNIIICHSGNNGLFLDNTKIKLNYLYINDVFKNGILINNNVDSFINYLYIKDCYNFSLFVNSNKCKNILNFRNVYFDIIKSKGVTNINGDCQMDLNIKEVINDSENNIEESITNDDFIEFIK